MFIDDSLSDPETDAAETAVCELLDTWLEAGNSPAALLNAMHVLIVEIVDVAETPAIH